MKGCILFMHTLSSCFVTDGIARMSFGMPPQCKQRRSKSPCSLPKIHEKKGTEHVPLPRFHGADTCRLRQTLFPRYQSVRVIGNSSGHRMPVKSRCEQHSRPSTPSHQHSIFSLSAIAPHEDPFAH